MGIKETVLKWLIPSNIVEKVKGSKLYMGLVLLTLWAAIYAVPAVCTSTACVAVAAFGHQAQVFIVSLGINVSSEMLDIGSILALLGVADKIAGHWLTKIVLKLLRLLEGSLAKLAQRSA